MNSYIGRKFEKVCKEILWELNRKEKLPFVFTQIGRQWGRLPNEPSGKNQYEIDICAFNEKAKEILFGRKNLKGVLTRKEFKDIRNEFRKDFESFN